MDNFFCRHTPQFSSSELFSQSFKPLHLSLSKIHLSVPLHFHVSLGQTKNEEIANHRVYKVKLIYTFFSCQVNRIQQVVRFGLNHGFNSQSSQGRRNRVSTGFTGNQRLTQLQVQNNFFGKKCKKNQQFCRRLVFKV